MQQPQLVLNWAAIGVTLIAAFIYGFLWYGPLFGKTWAKLVGISMEGCKPDPKKMIPLLGFQMLGIFLTTYVLAHTIQVWRPSVWGVGQDGPNYMYGLYGGIFTWIGFYIPLQMGKVLWERRPVKLFFLNTAHDFILLQLICQILANWR